MAKAKKGLPPQFAKTAKKGSVKKSAKKGPPPFLAKKMGRKK